MFIQVICEQFYIIMTLDVLRRKLIKYFLHKTLTSLEKKNLA